MIVMKFLDDKNMTKKKSHLCVRQFVISDTLDIFMRNDVGKQKFVDFIFLIRFRYLRKNIQINNSSILNSAKSILANHISSKRMFSSVLQK